MKPSVIRLAGPAALGAAALLLTACEPGPVPLCYGQDECAECKMTLVDQHYGAELITGRGKVFKFDDLNCLLAHQRRTAGGGDPKARWLVVDFSGSRQLLNVDQAWFLQHEKLRTPMASGLGAFATETELETVRRELGGGGQRLRWPQVRNLFP